MAEFRTLRSAGWLFVATWCIHTADHMRRGVELLPAGVIWGGTFAAMLATAGITLILVGHPAAPIASAAIFPALAIGVAASHLPPDWGTLSDPIVIDSATDGWSILAVSGEILGALWLGVVAYEIVRRNHFSVSIEPGTWVRPVPSELR